MYSSYSEKGRASASRSSAGRCRIPAIISVNSLYANACRHKQSVRSGRRGRGSRGTVSGCSTAHCFRCTSDRSASREEGAFRHYLVLLLGFGSAAQLLCFKTM